MMSLERTPSSIAARVSHGQAVDRPAQVLDGVALASHKLPAPRGYGEPVAGHKDIPPG